MAPKIKIKPPAGPRKGPRPSRNVLDALQWEEIKLLWFQGKYNFSQLATKFGTSKAAIDKRSSNEGWREQKLKLLQDAQAKIRENVLSMFVDAGLPPEKLIELIAKGAIDTTKLQNVKTAPIKFKKTIGTGRNRRTVELKPYTLDETISVTDNDTTRFYRELAVRVLDLFPPPKKPIDGEPEDPNRKIPVISNL